MTDDDGGLAVETAEQPETEASNGEPVVRAEGVWKVFGPHGERIIGTPDADLSRGELREKTGNVVAVRDVSAGHPAR
jgi:glycine betaine/proline transport system ATP-binding protein